MTSLRTRLALAAIAGLVTAAGLYAIVRGVQLVLFAEPNPALVIWSAHAGFFWRAWIVTYAGGMGAMLGYVAATRDVERTARALATAVLVAGVLVLAQGVLLP